MLITEDDVLLHFLLSGISLGLSKDGFYTFSQEES